ncbi:dihydroxyacetone kinase subunit DhaL [Tessaracoccus flavus]|uniref:Dihydroxyacetone kinase subunit L n=1 Tax=Tessaracoccus flavus TaxID=1610493 RepID=A0A1Q2CCK9_9ACTN|nr:dihydroxyacetone kinase subunit DhaL [Tessaracoccus flavus]AQP43836.1 dihydroxyacetone kinase subunit L [Tessaracoccus flavus]SDY25617.1 dihydroxyacetone kinase DhaL subunit [Tessaracoccus flavus]
MADGVMAVTQWLRECAEVFDARADELNKLDRLLGDGDHGTNMARGLAAARELDLTPVAAASDALRHVGMALVSTVGGASGPLFGTFFLRAGANWPRPIQTAGVASAFEAGLAGVMARGNAERGDKTMIDALAPASDALREAALAHISLGEAMDTAAAAAERGRDNTRSMIAKRGRSALLADKSIGVVDPGAVSVAIILRTAANHVG